MVAQLGRSEVASGNVPFNQIRTTSLVFTIPIFGELQANGRWLVSTQDPVHLDDQSEPEPDVMLLKPAADDYTGRHPRPDDVFLIIEVSDTTLDYDREEKLPAYGRAGVPEVWIVNLLDATLEVYREPHFEGYSSKAFLRTVDIAKPQAFPDDPIPNLMRDGGALAGRSEWQGATRLGLHKIGDRLQIGVPHFQIISLCQ